MIPLWLCVFVADFFGCVKGGTHPENHAGQFFKLPEKQFEKLSYISAICQHLSGRLVAKISPSINHF
ncbi:Uncharacterized protein dnm_100180 [Desulfonema magnum]|uniref:Uncharacterized protein n=1 Tax=Desulfonema magnum TaxID=45655 RepID=A0A975C0S3_9BACT|nr:Uncharacterized protein dnm_100180 [Desulfonema magnum]